MEQVSSVAGGDSEALHQIQQKSNSVMDLSACCGSELIAPMIDGSLGSHSKCRSASWPMESTTAEPDNITLEDASYVRKKRSRRKEKRLDNGGYSEGHLLVAVHRSWDGSMMGAGTEVGSNPRSSASTLEQAEGGYTTDMHRANGSPYPSDDEWKASDHSDTDADHSDSSDDDDPTSQVDRMIERGTRLFMDGVNSNLSSEADDTDGDDSNSDITDVSPIVSTTASPLGLSPVMSRRKITSLLNHQPFFHYYSKHDDEGDDEDEYNFPEWTNPYSSQLDDKPVRSSEVMNNNADSTNMSLLMQAVIELEKASSTPRKRSRHSQIPHSKSAATSDAPTTNSSSKTYPRTASSQRAHLSAVHSNPHHRHLRKNGHVRRKNMTFTNEEVRIIDRDNSILLDKILAVHSRSKQPSSYPRPTHKPANAAINRRRQDERIRRDNLMLLRRIQESKPSPTLVGSRGGSSLQYGLPSRSCSATARQTFYHHTRKETTL